MMSIPLDLVKQINAAGLTYDVRLVPQRDQRFKKTGHHVYVAVLMSNGTPVSGLLRSAREVEIFIAGIRYGRDV